MVDSTKGIGQVPGVVSLQNRTASSKGETRDVEEKSAPTDEVSISPEALSLQEAEQSATAARKELEGSDLTLGLDPTFDEAEA